MAALALAILNKAFPRSDAAPAARSANTKKQDHAAAGMMPALTSGDYCHGHLASVSGALRSRTFMHRLPRSGLVYWRKIIAGAL
jgi:hypothetical protein